MNVAGITCHAWSGEGLQEGEAHESEMPLNAWLAERVFMMEALHEDVAFLECTPRFPAQERLQEAFKSAGVAVTVVSVHDCPSFHGCPHRRKRVLAAVINNKTTQWLGHEELSSVQKEYSDLFRRQRMCDYRLLLQAPIEERVGEIWKMARKRRFNVDVNAVREMIDSQDLHSVARISFPPGAIERLRSWRQLFLDSGFENMICDIDHRVGEKGLSLSS